MAKGAKAKGGHKASIKSQINAVNCENIIKCGLK